MTIETDALVEFLLARIADDEAADKAAGGFAWPPSSLQFQRAEFRAACRRFAVAFWAGLPWLGRAWLRKMAAPYAAHPDFRPEWRP